MAIPDNVKAALRGVKWKRTMCLDTEDAGVIVDGCADLPIARNIITPRGRRNPKDPEMRQSIVYMILDGPEPFETERFEEFVLELVKRGIVQGEPWELKPAT